MSTPSILSLDFDSRVFRLTAVKKAAYCFGDRCGIEIEIQPQDIIRVRLTPRKADTDLQAIENDLRNAVLDYDLREHIAAATEGIRNLLLAQAFSEVSLIDGVGESADFRDDPLGITRDQSKHS